MTDIDLDALEALEHEATGGPWEHDWEIEPFRVQDCGRGNVVCYTSGRNEPNAREQFVDAEFIVAFRNAAPALLAELRALRTWKQEALDDPNRADAPEGEPVLCLIKDDHAWFTTQPLATQWGDDWDDAPYEHNAGSPYAPIWMDERDGTATWEIVKVYFDVDLERPCDGRLDGPYSVEAINDGAAPWLRSGKYTVAQGVAIWGGTTLRAFCAAIEAAGGKVYLAQGDDARLVPPDWDPNACRACGL